MGEESRRGFGEDEGGVLDCFKPQGWFGFLCGEGAIKRP